MLTARKPAWARYGLALLLFLLALLVRFEIDDALPPGFPYLTFFPAVLVATVVGGTGPGVVCATLSGLAAWYFFMPPAHSFGMDGATALALGFYVLVVTVDILLIRAMSATLVRLRRQQELTSALYDRQRVMFQELQHHVANNMAFVAALLHLQKRRVAEDPSSAPEALDQATQRLDTMARIHRRLYDSSAVDLPVGQYLRELTADLLQATGAKNIVCLVDVPAIRLDTSRLVTLSLLVVEAITNSLKHAFEPGGSGTIQISMEQLDPDRLALTVADNGRGLPPELQSPAGKNFGFKIIQSLAAQIGGELSVSGAPGGGTTLRLVFAP